MSEHDDLEELERELGAIFDATAFQPELGQVHDAARLAAQVPSVAREGWWYWKQIVQVPLALAMLAILVTVGVQAVPQLKLGGGELSPQSVTDGDHGVELAMDEGDWEDLELLSAGDLGLELLDLPSMDSDPVAWEEAYESLLEEI